MSSIERLSAAEHALERASTPAEVKAIYDLAEAYRTYTRSGEEQNKAASLKLRAGAKGGAMLASDPDLGRGGDRPSGRLPLARHFPGLNHEAAKTLSSRWQRLNGLEQSGVLAAYLASDADEISMAGLAAYATTGNLFSSASPEWYTPIDCADAARRVLGAIDLDPASSAEANEVIRAARYFTQADRALEQPWHGRVFINPPYGRSALQGCSLFIPKLVAEHRAGRTTAAIALVSAHSTDAEWFQHLWDFTLCFTDHRLAFWRPDTDTSGALFGSVFAYLGPDRQTFIREFVRFGAVVVRAPA